MQRSRGCATILNVEVDDAAETLRGHLLVAVPQLLDPNFHRAVVLLLQHDEDGAIGLVINQRASHSMLEVATGVGLQWRGDPEQPVGIEETVRGAPRLLGEVTKCNICHDSYFGKCQGVSAWP